MGNSPSQLPEAPLVDPHNELITCLHYNGGLLVAGSLDKTISVWNVETSTLLYRLEGHTDAITALDVSDTLIASSSKDKTIKVWNGKGGKLLYTLEEHKTEVTTIIFEKQALVSGSEDGLVCLWNGKTGKLLRKFEGHTGPIVRVLVAGLLIVSASKDKTIKLWEIDSGKLHNTFNLEEDITCAHLFGNVVVAGSKQGFVEVFNVKSGEKMYKLDGHSGPVNQVVITNHFIASASDDHTIRVWKVTGDLSHVLKGHTEPVIALDQSHEFIVSGSNDRSIRVWDARDGSLVREMDNQPAPVDLVAMAGPRLATAAGVDLKMWKISPTAKEQRDRFKQKA